MPGPINGQFPQRKLYIPNEQPQTQQQHTENIRSIRDWANAPEAWSNYTPIWTSTFANVSLGNGSLLGRFYRWRNFVDFNIFLTFGSTTSGGTGTFSFTLPFLAVPGIEQYTLAKAFTAGPFNFAGLGYIAVAGAPGQANVIPLFPQSTSATNVAQAANSTNPATAGTGTPTIPGNFTWGNGNNLVICGRYQCL